MERRNRRELGTLTGALGVLILTSTAFGRSAARLRVAGVRSHRYSDRRIRALEQVSMLGRATTLWPIVGVQMVRLARANRPVELRHLAATTVGAGAAVQSLRSLVVAPRPAAGMEISTSSFPSGHATMCAATLGSIALSRSGRLRTAGLVASSLIATLVAHSRAVLGKHWPVDAYGGLIVGWLWLGVVEATFPSPRATTA